LIFAAPAQAQGAYPDRNILLVIPFAPGGPTDVFARPAFQKQLAQFGIDFVTNSAPEAARGFIARERARFRPVVDAAGVKTD
jgi:tripartite-type tricarboxylate transporter receptor subunit TctC